MRINIKGNAVTPDMIADALKTCEREYGLKVKSATLYVRFENEDGDVVEPICDGNEIIRDFVYSRTKEVVAPQPEPQITETSPELIAFEELVEITQRNIGRLLRQHEMKSLFFLADVLKVDKETFVSSLEATIRKRGCFDARYLERMVTNKMTR